MRAEVFENLLERRIDLTRAVLSFKAWEYASDADRLQNFVDAAALLFPDVPEGESAGRAKAALAFMTKHVVSVYQMVRSGDIFTRAQWDEKIGDLVNYCVLLEAALEDDGKISV